MAKCGILLADDDLEDHMIIADAFKEIEFLESVHFVANGEEVLEFLSRITDASQLPYLIILDLNMPKLNGTETLKAIKGNKQYSDIKVIIYSTSVNEREKKQCMELGAVSYITKPVKHQESLAIARHFSEYCQ